MSKKYQMHVISGTHWDREWRHTAEQSKLRLADLMDNIINILETKDTYKCFCVDGGMIVIEDYLSIRPEKKDIIKKLIENKRMIVVNWYTLPETNTVAPESLIRNLLLGHKMAAEFGGGMKSGYTATSYGQHSQMPQLYKGFGMETAIFYRGTNKYVLSPLFAWESPDGSTLDTLRTFDEVTRTNWFFYVHQQVVLGKPSKDLGYTYDREHDLVHPADMGLYEKAFVALREDHDYNHDENVMKNAIDAIMEQAEPYKIGNNILALNMEDNDEPYKLLPELINDLNGIAEDVEIKQTSLDEYMDTIRSVKDYEKALHKGELRYTTMDYNSFNALLGATHSSRIKIKLYNEKVENNLLNLAEPLATFASFYGKEYPRTNIDRAWSALLKNHAHDSICGAAVDLAHEDMMYNFSIANTVA
ncbi:MAG: mngB 1, partial [Oscillospiraceae bacterium]|nr:mngB 1 [Oscillospiraceae bacterium]